MHAWVCVARCGRRPGKWAMVRTSCGEGNVFRQNHSAPERFIGSSHSGLMFFLKSEKDSTERSLKRLRVRPSKNICDGFGMLLNARQKSSIVATSHSFSMLSSYDFEFLSGERCSQMTHSCSRKWGPPGGTPDAEASPFDMLDSRSLRFRHRSG